MPCMAHREFDWVALLIVTLVAREGGVELLGFLVFLWGVVIIVFQPLGSVVGAHCSRGV